jgi:hypothetical protein
MSPPLAAISAQIIATDVMLFLFGVAFGLALAAVICLSLLKKEGNSSVISTWKPGEEEIALITDRVRHQLAQHGWSLCADCFTRRLLTTFAATQLQEPESRGKPGDQPEARLWHPTDTRRVPFKEPLVPASALKGTPRVSARPEGYRSGTYRIPNGYRNRT